MSARLAGRTALITGAATGMGRAIAERFAAEGAKVVLFGLGGALLDQAAEATGGIAIRGDVTKADDIDAALAACGEGLDTLVNAAGIIASNDPETIDDATWERIFAVNVTGTMMTCRAALPRLKRNRGAVVNLASVAAFNTGPGMASYSASKAALVAFTRSLANAHGPHGVRANVVAPGWVRTPMSEMEMDVLARRNDTTREAEFEAVRQRIGLRRIAEPAEIAACCLFLASDEASFVTGAVLLADGGGRSPVSSRAV